MMSNPVLPELAEGLEAPVQLVYLIFLLGLLSAAAYTIVNQVLTRREMDERSKVLGELIRTGDAVSEDYFELGVVLARKRLFTQALKNYTKAVKLWDGEEVELAQVSPSFHQCYTNTRVDVATKLCTLSQAYGSDVAGTQCNGLLLSQHGSQGGCFERVSDIYTSSTRLCYRVEQPCRCSGERGAVERRTYCV